MTHIDDVILISNQGHQSVLVPGNIEDREITHEVGIPKVDANIGGVAPVSRLRDSIPAPQRLHCVTVDLTELTKRRFADYPQS